jgi:hypothetical protein
MEGGVEGGREGERGRKNASLCFLSYWGELHERLLQVRHPKYYNEVRREGEQERGREEEGGMKTKPTSS